MKNFLHFIFAGTLFIGTTFEAKAMLDDSFDLDQAIANIETYYSTEHDLKIFNKNMETEKQQLFNQRADVEMLEWEIKQNEEDMRKVFHITPGENIQSTIDKLNGERQKLVMANEEIDQKKIKAEQAQVSIRMKEENLRKHKLELINLMETLEPSIMFYKKFFPCHMNMTPEALCRSVKGGHLYATVFFMFIDRPSLGFVTWEDRTLLHLAAWSGNSRLIKYILYQNSIDHVIDIHAKDARGMMAIDVAISQTNEDAAITLLKACKCQICIDTCKRACLDPDLDDLRRIFNQLNLGQ